MDSLICDLKKGLLLGFARITKEGFISFYDQASCFVNLCQKKGVGRASGSPGKSQVTIVFFLEILALTPSRTNRAPNCFSREACMALGKIHC